MIDGAHIRAVPGHQSRRLDVTVGKVETAGRPPRRFALAPMGAEQPAQAIRAALIEQGWRLGRPVTVISDGEPALPNLVCAAKGGPVSHILDWWHISMRVRHIEQALAGIYALRPNVPSRTRLRQHGRRAAWPPDLERLRRRSRRGAMGADPSGQ